MGGGVASGIAIPFLGTALEAARVNAENDGAEEAKISFSKGAATYRKGEDAEFRTVFKRADEAMYRDKDAYYREHYDPRRKH